MNSIVAFLERQYGNYNWRQFDSGLYRLSAHNNDCWRGITPSNFHADFNPEPPIFAAKFANCQNHRNILAIANEDGKIAVQNTDLVNSDIEELSLEGDQCHNNAVFDVEWIPGQMQLVSASGDHTACLWQVRENKFEHVRTFFGHTRSVKTAAFRKNDTACFATGSRDGSILIWDIRSRANVGTMPKADNCIYSGHAGGPGTPTAYRRKSTLQTPKLPPNASSSSITGLVFKDDYTLVSCGAGDGIIKVWDLRRNYSCYKKEPLPKHSIPYPGQSTLKGYTNLLFDDARQCLYVNCMDHNIYCFNLGVYETKPFMCYTGLTNSTFYIKSSLSPDGNYLISGSSDEKAYIWNVKQSTPLLSLVGHTREVTCVAWAKTNDTRIVTCSDDARHKVWRIESDNLEEDNSMNYKGKAETCEPRQSPKRKLKSLENTPRTVKRLMTLNETTPNSTEKISLKRSYSEFSAGDDQIVHNGDNKRQLIETRARRLFASCSSNGYDEGRKTLTDIPEEIESEKLLSPLNERNQLSHQRVIEIRSPSTSLRASCSSMSISFSPTSNLPNYVIDGDAPHLKLQSPKRKLKENVDWLTKIRKQKLSSTINDILNDKSNGTPPHVADETQTQTLHISTNEGLTQDNGSGILSPRVRKIKSSDRSSAYGSPSSSAANRHSTCGNGQRGDEIRTPTRRTSETTLLRFFCVTPTSRNATQSPSTTNKTPVTGSANSS